MANMAPELGMSREPLAILNSPELLRSREAHFARLQDLFGGEDQDRHAFALWGVAKGGDVVPRVSSEAKVSEALSALAQDADRLLDPQIFRPLVVEFGIYGVHFVDKLLGARVFNLDGSWQVEPLGAPVGQLEAPDLSRNETWIQARELAQEFVASRVTVPLFSLPTIASALNVAVNLYGSAFLSAMLTTPEGARHDLAVINDLLCELHRGYLATVPAAQLQPVVGAYRTQPPGFGQLCGCTTQLLSPRLYRDFVAPLDEKVLSVYPRGGMIHLCGSHTQHIPTWRNMAPLRALQLNDRAAGNLKTYFNELLPDQLLYVNPCETMPVERIMEITGGHRVVIVADITDARTIERGRRRPPR